MYHVDHDSRGFNGLLQLGDYEKVPQLRQPTSDDPVKVMYEELISSDSTGTRESSLV